MNQIQTSSLLVKKLCEQQNISLSELARRLGQSPQNFIKKINRNTINGSELLAIANTLNVVYEQSFTLNNGKKLYITNKNNKEI